ncbi:MAG TPA: efflux RND transporter periplasmic adaptor subunit [Stellaceae bacterium]|nr:efflux RND transporter periplasmic adaptor subunit [Stellaceae bacterium]
MDGDGLTKLSSEALSPDRALRERVDAGRPVAPRPRTVRWFLVVGVLVALVLGALYGFDRFRSHMIASFLAHNKPPPAAVSVVAAKAGAAPRFAHGVGSLSAVQEVTIAPELAGRVTRIFFKSGAMVKAGDPLVQLDDGPEQGDLANYEAQYRLAQLTLERAKRLASGQFTAQQTVDQDQSQLDQIAAQIQKTRAIIAQKLIRAPFAGRLGIRHVDLGQYVNPGAAIVTLTDLSTLYVNFTLPSQQRAEIALGQTVDVTADAFPGRAFKAKITTIEPQLDPDTRTLAIQASLANPDHALLPGMFVDAAVVLPAQPDVVVLPETAVDYTLYGDSAYVIRAQGKDKAGRPILVAERRPVKTGARWKGLVAVLSGLRPGERVVSAGQIKLHDGAEVAVSPTPAPQPPAHPALH